MAFSYFNADTVGAHPLAGLVMTDSINKWVLENLYLLPIFIVGMAITAHTEIKRLDKRCDALIALLKSNGIDIMKDDDWEFN